MLNRIWGTTAEIAELTDESVCPKLGRKDCDFAGQALSPAKCDRVAKSPTRLSTSRRDLPDFSVDYTYQCGVATI